MLDIKKYGSQWKSNRRSKAHKRLCKTLAQIQEDRRSHNATVNLVEQMKAEFLKDEVERKERTFEKEIAKTRPVLNERATTARMDINASKLAKELTEVMTKAISFQMACTFSQKMLTQDLGIDGASFDMNTMMDFSKKISRIPVIHKLAEHFGLTKAETDKILELTMQKNWGPKDHVPAPAQQRQAPVESREDTLAKINKMVEERLPTPTFRPYGDV